MSEPPRTPAKPPNRIRLLHPETTAVTEGFEPDLSLMAARPPIYPVSTYCFRSAAEAKHFFDQALNRAEAGDNAHAQGLIYARLNNPNAEMFEDALTSLEPGAKGAASFASGMAAITNIFLTFLKPGDVVLYTRPLYGGTHHVLDRLIPRFGITAVGVDAGNAHDLVAEARAIGEHLAMVYIETPANPTLRMTDIAAAAAGIHGLGRHEPPLLVVDNTFLGPLFQAPLTCGADLSVYSATKYIGGHSDLVAGAVTAKDRALLDALKVTRSFFGTICEPFSAWLLQRSLATIHTRMVKQSKNAVRLAERLRDHPKVKRVHYPTFFAGDQARIYKEQCTAPGGMIAFEVEGGREGAFRVLDALRIAKLAVSLGGVETLVTHPRTTTSSEVAPDELERAEITEGLVRWSTGVEYWRDLARDLEQALEQA